MVVTFSDGGQSNVPEIEPPEIVAVAAEVIGVPQLVPISIGAEPVDSKGQAPLVGVPSSILLPVTVIGVLTGPDPGPNEIEGVPRVHAAGAACAALPALQLSAVSANASTAEHMISAMLVETIFDRFTPVFMLPSPKDRADFANKIVSPT